MAFSKKLTKLKSDKGLSSGQLAQLTGLSRGYLWQLESGGKANPSLEVLQRLAEALGVTVAELSDTPSTPQPKRKLPPGLDEFIQLRRGTLNITDSDIDVLKAIHFRGAQPRTAEDWELLYLFLRKIVRSG